jgi:DNA ligase (NAD+)
MIKSLGKLFDGFTGKVMVTPVELHASKTCLECGSRLARDTDNNELNAVWHCPNPDCPPQVLKRIILWASPEAMYIKDCDAALAAQLVSRGLVRDATEFYRLKLKEIEALSGLDKGSSQKFFDAITASLKRDAWRLLYGLGIPTIGVEEAVALGKGFPSVDAVFAAGAPRLMQEAGVSATVAENIVRWYGDSVNRKLVKRLEKAGLNFKSELYRPDDPVR